MSEWSLSPASKQSSLGKSLALAAQHYAERVHLHTCATYGVDPDAEHYLNAAQLGVRIAMGATR